ncbi:hypothetical protein [Streptomyces sp. NPDC127084]|uniref:hypothetical protein n=1 Tax=Streptomyces sp. NPDC127084 TaxID=3347133 RepID=UPI00365BB828
MTVDQHPMGQLPADVLVFTRYLGELAGRLDPDAGWYGVFWRRDPEGLTACLQGAEIPPWDVVESLLQDLGAGPVEHESAQALHSAAAAAYDLRAGGPEAVRERLELMRREQSHAAARGQELLRRLALLAVGSPDYETLAHELSWANDDHARAAARCVELSGRLAALPPPGPGGGGAEPAPGGAGSWFHPRGGRNRTPDPDPVPDPASGDPASGHAGSGPLPGHTDSGQAGQDRPDMPQPDPPHGSGGERRWWGWSGPARRRSRGARYAPPDGADPADSADPVPGEVADDAVPPLPIAGTRPRGARFGGLGGPADAQPDAGPEAPVAGPPDEQTRRAAVETVAALGVLRAEGRGGEAHAVLCQAATRPAAWLPALGDELRRAGLGADWATLLWEAASLPPGPFAAAARALAAAGRADDCGRLLRQSVARPPAEIAEAVLALGDTEDQEEAHALLIMFVRARAPEDAARLAASDPRALVPVLLSAARAVSPERERDLVHALRVAGLLSK